VYVDGRRVSASVKDGWRVLELISSLGMGRETVIAKVNGSICTEFEPVCSKDRIELIRVSSGG